MKNALISPNETVYDYDGVQIGQRVAQVSSRTFDVALPLFWVECADDVEADYFYYVDGNILPIPLPPPPVPQEAPTIVE